MTDIIKIKKYIDANVSISQACMSYHEEPSVWLNIKPKKCVLQWRYYTTLRWGTPYQCTVFPQYITLFYKNFIIFVEWNFDYWTLAKDIKHLKEGDIFTLKSKNPKILKAFTVDTGEDVDSKMFDIEMEVRCTIKQNDGLFEEVLKKKIDQCNKYIKRYKNKAKHNRRCPYEFTNTFFGPTDNGPKRISI